MIRSEAQSMRFSPCTLRNTFCSAALFAVVGLIGCGNNCFVGFSNNGNGIVSVQVGNAQAGCSVTRTNGAVRAVAVKSPVCEACTVASRVQHIFVTPRSIQLRPSAAEETSAADGLEIAPQLASEPRQIDLMGESNPEILGEYAIVPAGNYREIRVQFIPDAPENTERLPAENACGVAGWNCMVMADGRVEPLRRVGDARELRIGFGDSENGSLVVLPDSRMDLQLSLKPLQAAYFSSSEGWKLQSFLVGRVRVARLGPVEQDSTSR